MNLSFENVRENLQMLKNIHEEESADNELNLLKINVEISNKRTHWPGMPT